MKPKPIWMAVVTDDMEISEVVNEPDYQVNDTTTAAGILDTEITG